jgi:integrase/recombinase XerD
VLTIYRRHSKTCPHKARSYRRCKCNLWVQGTLSGEKIRQSLDLTSWEAAQNLIREWETKGKLGGVAAPDISHACEKFIEDAIARGVRDSTLVLIRRVIKHFVEWCEGRGFRRLSQVDIEQARKYRASWTYAPVTAAKKLERLRGFFRFCVEAGWIEKNPFQAVKSPILKQTPTMPFSGDEFKKLLDACGRFSNKGVHGFSNGTRMKAFILLLRYSGLRRTDAVSISEDKVRDGKVFLYTQKTGTPVWVPIPAYVVEVMESVRKGSYYFWSGNGGLKAATSSWDRAFRKLCTLAGVKGHFHMLRDTFAVSLLLAGTPIEDVAILLGHASTKVTEKHYSPWIKARQQRLEERVRAVWEEPEEPTRLRVIQGGA